MLRGASASPATNNKASLTSSDVALRMGVSQINSPSLESKIIFYNFLSENPNPLSMPSFHEFEYEQKLQTRKFMDSWSDVANIVFIEDPSKSSGLSFGNYSEDDNRGAYFISSINSIFINNFYSDKTDPILFTSGMKTLGHEIGHSIGLSHPGIYNAGKDEDGKPIPISYELDAKYYEDSNQYTIMSYFKADKTGANYGLLVPAGPQLDDIFAIQQLYGPNMSTRLGNTTYGFNASSDVLDYQKTSGGDLIFSVWDAGGTDTFDFSGYSTNQIIDLREGHFSSVGSLTKNVSIAYGAIIENAIGGSGSDTIYGNDYNNTIFASGGIDIIFGGLGFDTFSFETISSGINIDPFSIEGIPGVSLSSIEKIIGTSSSDIFKGGAGVEIDGSYGEDTIDFDFLDTGITYGFIQGEITSALGTMKVSSIENVIGSKGSDLFIANGSGVTFYGSKSALVNPSAYSITGNDTFIAAQGADKFISNNSHTSAVNTLDFSRVTGGINMAVNLDGSGFTQLGHEFIGMSKFIGTSEDDFFSMSSEAAVTLETGGGNDTVYANTRLNVDLGADDDTIFVNELSSNNINGGSGFDIAYYANSDNFLYIDKDGENTTVAFKGLNGTVNYDKFINIEKIQFDEEFSFELNGDLFVAGDIKSSFAISSFSSNSPTFAITQWYYRPYSPLILDMNGDGLASSTLLATSTVQFDMNRDGFSEKTAWVAPGDALLAFDVNGNGIIDNSSELFGGSNIDGFSVLAEHDSNLDGIISELDENYSNLVLWKDSNQDGKTDEGEITGLSELGILLINLSATKINETNNGNPVTHRSTFTKADGTIGRIDDVWFKPNLAFSYDKEVDNWTPSSNIAGIPTLVSYGTAHNFLWSVDQRPELRQAVLDIMEIAKDGDLEQFRIDFQALLANWLEVPNDANAPRNILTKLYGDTPEYLKEDWVTRGEAETLDIEFQHALDSMAGKFLAQIADITYGEEGVSSSLTSFKDLGFGYFNDELIGNKVSAGLSIIGELSSNGVDNTGLALRFISQNMSVNERLSYFNELISKIPEGLDLTLSQKYILKSYTVDKVINSIYDRSLGGIKYGTDQGDYFGGDGTETMLPGKGNDTINSGDGPDVFIYRLGDGHDTYTNVPGNNSPGGADQVILADGIISEMVSFSVASDDESLIMHIGSEGSITFKGAFSKTPFTKIYYDNGDEIVLSSELTKFLNGTENDDRIIGNSAANTISGLEGNDRIIGNSGNDILYGNEGNDTLFGGAGDDVLVGGTGDDFINQGGGRNKIYYNLGDGNDIISNNTDYKIDEIFLGSGITKESIFISQHDDGKSFRIKMEDGGSITIEHAMLVSASQAFTLKFFNGTQLNYSQILALSQIGGDGDDFIRANNTSSGQILDGGAGNDKLIGYSSNDILNGGTGVDSIHGSLGNDRITGGAGDDSLEGGVGNDIYVWNAGDGNDTIINERESDPNGFYLSYNHTRGSDIIEFGNNVLSSNLSYKQSGNDLLISHGEETINIKNGYSSDLRVTTLKFNDGTTISVQNIINNIMLGTSEDDRIIGTTVADNLRGGLGNDYLSGGGGNDIYHYNIGDGNDVIDESPNNGVGGSDTLKMGPGITRSDIRIIGGEIAGSIRVTIAKNTPNEGSVNILNGLGQYNYAIDKIVLDDGTTINVTSIKSEAMTPTDKDDVIWGGYGSNYGVTIRGLAGNDKIHGVQTKSDSLFGDDGDDILFGGVSAETASDGLYGGNGNDTLIYDHNDFRVQGDAGSDTLDFRFYEGFNIQVDLSLNTTGKVSFNGGPAGIKTVYTMENAILNNGNDTFIGSDESNMANGLAGNDTLSGLGGSDTLYGGDGNDLLNGGSGNNFLYGENGDDILISLGMSDELSGGTGIDIFRFASSASGQSHNILDYEAGVDTIDLRDIGNEIEAQNNSGLIWIDSSNFSGAMGEVRNGENGLEIDINGDGVADIFIGLISPVFVDDLML